MRASLRTIVVAMATCVAFDAAAQPTDSWSTALLADAQGLHDSFLDSHPGAVDPENPGFRTALATGLVRARERAPRVDSYAGYRAALREYAAAFNDAHVNLGETARAPQSELQWPGFLTREEGGRQVVNTRVESAAAPPMGAVLVSCDGKPAAQLASDNVGRFRGNWNLESQREAHAWRLLLDVGNPFVQRPSECAFEVDGRLRPYTLAWAPLSHADYEVQAKKVSATFRTGVELRPFGGKGLWLSAGTFNASTEEGRKLEGVVKRLNQDRAALRSAEILVLDVRGNSGGSSQWGRRIAGAVWGEANAAAATPPSGGVDWRASSANIAAMQAIKDGPGAGLFTRVWAGAAVAGMQKARAAGLPFWRESLPLGGLRGARGGASRAIDPGRFNTTARVYVLTDATCASACLDALDVWKKLGAVHVGRETSADSLYMEVRDQPLPSGYSRISVPMKVYRGRSRGLNEPHRPVHRIGGDMSDARAMEAEIMALARSPRAESR